MPPVEPAVVPLSPEFDHVLLHQFQPPIGLIVHDHAVLLDYQAHRTEDHLQQAEPTAPHTGERFIERRQVRWENFQVTQSQVLVTESAGTGSKSWIVSLAVTEVSAPQVSCWFSWRCLLQVAADWVYLCSTLWSLPNRHVTAQRWPTRWIKNRQKLHEGGPPASQSEPQVTRVIDTLRPIYAPPSRSHRGSWYNISISQCKIWC